jgi:hypothetical protein
MGTVPANQRRYSTVVAIETVPVPELGRYSSLIERLACGHFGANHGGIWDGGGSAPRNDPAAYEGLIGKKRQCRTCSADATQQVEQGGFV